MKLVRAMTLQREGSAEVTRDNSIDFGAAELAGFRSVHLNVALQVGGLLCLFWSRARMAVAGQ